MGELKDAEAEQVEGIGADAGEAALDRRGDSLVERRAMTIDAGCELVGEAAVGRLEVLHRSIQSDVKRHTVADIVENPPRREARLDA